MGDILVFNPFDDLLAILSNEAEDACPIWNAPYQELLNRGSTVQLTAPAEHEDSQHLTEDNQIAFIDRDGYFRLFVIWKVEMYDGAEGPGVTAYCKPGFLEVAEMPIEDVRPYNTTLKDAATRALKGCRWQVGIVADLGLNSTNFYFTTVKQALEDCVNTWGGELRDRIEIEDNTIVGKYIDILPRRGQDAGKRVEIDKDIISWRYESETRPYTAAYGRGASLETENGGFTRRITFADVEWKVANGDPVDKPLGQMWVGDPHALQEDGLEDSNGQLMHRFYFYENGNLDDPAEILKETWADLQKQRVPYFNLEVDVLSLEEMSGYEHEKARLGDTLLAYNDSFARPLDIEARIISYTYDLADPDAPAVIELGEFIDRYGEEERDRIDKIESKLDERTGIWDNPPVPEINPKHYPDIKPSKPIVIAEANFASVNLTWEYAFEEFYTQAFEVFVSEIPSFTVTADNLVYRGIGNGYNFIGEANKQYYFRVRAVNYHGRYSDMSNEVSATTARIISEDILFGPEVAAELRELSKTADILAPGSVDLDKIKQEALDQINQSAQDYSKKEIQKVADEINLELADKAGLDYVDGKLLLKVDANKYQADIAGIQEGMENVQNQVDEDVERLTSVYDSLLSKVEANREELVANQGKIITVEQNIDTLNGSLSSAVTILSELDNTVSEQKTLVEQQANQIRYLASQDSVDQLTGRVDSTEASMTILEDRISSKAEASSVYTKTEVNSALGKKIDSIVYNNKMSQLDVAVSGIKADVRSVESEVSSVGSRVVNVQSQLEVQAGQIEAKAERNQVYTKTEADGRLSTEISKAKADIKVTTDGISTSVSKLDSKIDGIEIGGRNIIKDSRTFSPSSNNYSAYPISHSRLSEGGREFNRIFRTETNLSPGTISIYNTIPKENIDVDFSNKVFTFSFYARASHQVNFSVMLYVSTTNETIRGEADKSNISLTKEWKRYSFTQKFDFNWDEFRLLRLTPFVSNNLSGIIDDFYLDLCEFKAEEGNKSTPWTPSTSDMENKFSEVNTSISSIDQKADSITLSVNTLTQTVIGHTSTISSINTSITQMDGKIVNKAEKSEVIAVDGKVNTVSNKVATLEVGVNGISTLVSSKVNQADVNKSIDDAKTIKDTRNTNESPQYYWTNYKRQKVDEFKNRSGLSAPGTVTYGYLTTEVPWSDSSGGPIIQRFASADGTYERRSVSTTTWTPWVQIESTAGSQAKVNALKSGEIDPLKSRVSNSETSITQLKSEITFKATQDSVDLLTGRMSKAESSLTVQAKQIEAKVDSNGVIAAINLQPGTVKIKAGLIDLVGDVYINNGRTYISTAAIKTAAIADAAITRAKLGTAVIGDAQIENGVITNAKIKDVSADKMTTGTLKAIDIRGVNIQGSTIISTDGSRTTTIRGGYLSSRGQYRRTWFGDTFTSTVNLELKDGYFRAHNETRDRRLYYSDFGISTYLEGFNDEDANAEYHGSGVIEFFSHMYNGGEWGADNVRGLTLFSNRGNIALKTNVRDVILDADRDVKVIANRGPITLRPRDNNRAGNNHFVFNVKNNDSPSDTDGWIAYGSPNTNYGAGLRFKKSSSGEPTIWVTNGNGDFGSGSLDAKRLIVRDYIEGNIQAPSNNIYAQVKSELRVTDFKGYNNGSPNYMNFQASNVRAYSIQFNGTSSQDFYFGVSSNELRITNNSHWNGGNTGYKPIRASDFIKSSSRNFKSNITKLEDIGLESVLSLEICRFELNTNIEEGKYDPKIGVIAEDSPAIVTRDGLGVEQDKLTYFNTKAIQELYSNQVKHDLRINDLELTVQYQKLIIEELDAKVQKLESAAA